MAPRVLVIQPAPYASVGRLQEWWHASGLELDLLSPSEGDAVPAAVDHDALVVMGGSMGANDDDTFPWLTDIKALLARTSADAVPTLGVCLGHQLLAVACGGTVIANPLGITAGLRDVRLQPAAAADPLLETLETPVAVQWNDDIVVDLPAHSTLLAATVDGVPQAFRVGEKAWGVQFHPEVDAVRVKVWADRDVAESSMTSATASALLAEIEASDAELVRCWQPWAERFAAVVTQHAAGQ